MRRLAFLLLAFLASAASAEQRTYIRSYDLASTSFIYCATGPFVAGQGALSTSGSSTTTTANRSAFGVLASGDELWVNITVSGVTTFTRRTVSGAPASTTSLTVNSAWDLSAGNYAWQYRKVSCGTAATNGWLNVANTQNRSVGMVFTTINATSIQAQIQCRWTGEPALPVFTVYPDPSKSTSTVACESGTFTAAGDCSVIITGLYDECRLGFKINTDTGAQDIAGYLFTESVR